MAMEKPNIQYPDPGKTGSHGSGLRNRLVHLIFPLISFPSPVFSTIYHGKTSNIGIYRELGPGKERKKWEREVAEQETGPGDLDKQAKS